MTTTGIVTGTGIGIVTTIGGEAADTATTVADKQLG
jgi:hypothetical protein